MASAAERLPSPAALQELSLALLAQDFYAKDLRTRANLGQEDLTHIYFLKSPKVFLTEVNSYQSFNISYI